VSSQDTVGCTPHICKGNRVEVCRVGHLWALSIRWNLFPGLCSLLARLSHDSNIFRPFVTDDAGRDEVECILVHVSPCDAAAHRAGTHPPLYAPCYHSPTVTVQRQKDKSPDTPEVLIRIEDRCPAREHGL
jgi:hypothetical protein